MISVVNGYVCTSGCEAASAKQGKDPSAPPGSAPGTSSKTDKTSGFDSQPATILDGALKDVVASNAVSAASGAASAATSPRPSVNRLA